MRSLLYANVPIVGPILSIGRFASLDKLNPPKCDPRHPRHVGFDSPSESNRRTGEDGWIERWTRPGSSSPRRAVRTAHAGSRRRTSSPTSFRQLLGSATSTGVNEFCVSPLPSCPQTP